eukprot:CAMPEP_0172880658 /NCGR_PEP_ID=MMETSP1075-20121228/115584_1 /TAXON_ID=2916 /ORGANISM="Ceratium fusus, Strain PA161109" /LENGTH=38 /DNA_ID= /DNA_START= /DNA_END= /DNA_ORIENTATION=
MSVGLALTVPCLLQLQHSRENQQRSHCSAAVAAAAAAA